MVFPFCLGGVRRLSPKKDRLIADSFWFESRPPSFWKPLSRNIKSSLIQFLWNQRFRVPFRVPVLFPSAPEPSMNFNNSKLAHFLSFVCVFESKVPRHAFLGATKKKMKFCLYRSLVTESYSRDRGKQNGPIALYLVLSLSSWFLSLGKKL